MEIDDFLCGDSPDVMGAVSEEVERMRAALRSVNQLAVWKARDGFAPEDVCAVLLVLRELGGSLMQAYGHLSRGVVASSGVMQIVDDGGDVLENQRACESALHDAGRLAVQMGDQVGAAAAAILLQRVDQPDGSAAPVENEGGGSDARR